MKNVYPSIDYYNAGRKLEVCDDMIADFISNTKRGHFHHKIILCCSSKLFSFRLHYTLFFHQDFK